MSVSAADDEPLLDAARDAVLAFGVRRTTVSEVARRAGVSRMTVYRRYPDGAALLRALMTREFAALADRAAAETEGAGDARKRLVGATVRTVELLATHPLFERLLELDPDLLVPYITGRGRFQRLALDALVERVIAGQRDGSIRAADPNRLAEAIEVAARGFAFAAPALGAAERATALAELGRMLDAYLRPPLAARWRPPLAAR